MDKTELNQMAEWLGDLGLSVNAFLFRVAAIEARLEAVESRLPPVAETGDPQARSGLVEAAKSPK